jgi:hypothetical protein
MRRLLAAVGGFLHCIHLALQDDDRLAGRTRKALPRRFL